MKQWLLVGLGGMVGSVARYQLGEWMMRATQPEKWPLGTLAVNLSGCLLAGLLLGLGERYSLWNTELRLLVFTGLLGGYTTFSAFGMETIQLVRREEWLVATLYVGGSVAGGLVAVWLGIKIVTAWS